MVGVEFMALGTHFDNCASICEPVTRLIISLGSNVDMGQEGLDITLVLDGKNTSLQVLSAGQILVAVYLYWWINASSTDWFSTGPLPEIFWIITDPLAFDRAVSLAPPVLIYIVGFSPTTPFESFIIQGGRPLI